MGIVTHMETPPPAGFYPDPNAGEGVEGQQRWWDGQEWGEHVIPGKPAEKDGALEALFKEQPTRDAAWQQRVAEAAMKVPTDKDAVKAGWMQVLIGAGYIIFPIFLLFWASSTKFGLFDVIIAAAGALGIWHVANGAWTLLLRGTNWLSENSFVKTARAKPIKQTRSIFLRRTILYR